MIILGRSNKDMLLPFLSILIIMVPSTVYSLFNQGTSSLSVSQPPVTFQENITTQTTIPENVTTQTTNTTHASSSSHKVNSLLSQGSSSVSVSQPPVTFQAVFSNDDMINTVDLAQWIMIIILKKIYNNNI